MKNAATFALWFGLIACEPVEEEPLIDCEIIDNADLYCTDGPVVEEAQQTGCAGRTDPEIVCIADAIWACSPDVEEEILDCTGQ